MKGILEQEGPEVQDGDSPRPHCVGRGGNVGDERVGDERSLRPVSPLLQRVDHTGTRARNTGLILGIL